MVFKKKKILINIYFTYSNVIRAFTTWFSKTKFIYCNIASKAELKVLAFHWKESEPKTKTLLPNIKLDQNSHPHEYKVEHLIGKKIVSVIDDSFLQIYYRLYKIYRLCKCWQYNIIWYILMAIPFAFFILKIVLVVPQRTMVWRTMVCALKDRLD